MFSPNDDLDLFEDEILGEFFNLKRELQLKHEKVRYLEYLGEIPITASFLSITDKRFLILVDTSNFGTNPNASYEGWCAWKL